MDPMAENNCISGREIFSQYREPLAIIGIGCRFPGGADTPAAFWDLLLTGVDAIVDVPADRWDIRRFFDGAPEKPGTTYSRQAAFLRQPIFQFDPTFFGILPAEAIHIDPQQRLLLEVVWEALEDAGLAIDRLAGSDVGVYVGGFTQDAMVSELSPLNRDLISSHGVTAASMTMLSNRISYLFDFRGPSVSIDTACSSSLVAVNYACEDLWNGRCSLAIAGGVNVILRPEYPILMAKGGFLAPDSRCKTFDERANGYARGEGCGIIAIKPLAAAQRDSDRVYALIRATGVNQDGRTGGITMPNGDAQQQLIRRIYREAGFDPNDLSYIEAHGTGTAVGDPIETHAIGAILAECRAADNPCLIGSVKANIGHLEAAAGVAGIIKAALCLKYRQVPPQIHIQRPNPRIPFEELRLRLPLQMEPLPRNGRPACVSVNSFGYGGTNAHALLQEAPEETAWPAPAVAEGATADGKAQMLPLSARSAEALKALARAYLDLVAPPDGAPVPGLRDLAYAMSTRRSHHPHRLAVIADSHERFAEMLRGIAADDQVKGVVAGQIRRDQQVRPVFVFTGMGPQWWAMGRELYATEPVFHRAADEADAAFRRHAGWSILAEMLADQKVSKITSNYIAQPANFVLQVALAALWRSWGVEPAAIIGHSVGEVSAAYVAGALDLDNAARVSFHRSRVQQKAAGLGQMLAVGLTAAAAEDLIDSCRDRISVAAINSPGSVTLAGDGEVLAGLARQLEADGVFNRFLKVEIAYHSVQMEPLKDELLESLAGLEARVPSVLLYSTVTGRVVEGATYDADYWWRNVRCSVRFADAVLRLIDDGFTLFLEVGPHPVLGPSIRECLRHRHVQGDTLASLTREQPERASLLEALGGLYCHGFPVDWNRLHPEGGRFIPLPRYPWQREPYWMESKAAIWDRTGPDGHVLLGIPAVGPVPAWQADLNRNYLPWLNDHRIQGAVVFPGAGYVEAALAVQRAVDPDHAGVVEELEFRSALVIGPKDKIILRVGIDAKGSRVTIHSKLSGEDDSWRLHAVGRLSQAAPRAHSETIDLAAIQERCPPINDIAGLYRRFDADGLNYGPAFRIIERLWAGAGEVLAEIAGRPEIVIDDPNDRIHPTLLDAAFQALLAILPAGAGGLYLPVQIERVAVLAPPPARLWSHGRITKITGTGVIADLALCDQDGKVLVDIRGLRCQALADKGDTDAAEAIRNAWYVCQWEHLEAPAETAAGTGAAPADSDRWAVFADAGGTAAALIEQLAGHGATCLRIKPGAAFDRPDRDLIRVPRDDAAAMDRLVAEAGLQHCRGIAYLWGLDGAGESGDPVGLDACVPALHLVQALARQAGLERPQLFILTRGAHHITATDPPPTVTEASLWGLGRVIIAEHPELRCTLIDLGAEDSAAELAALADEMLAGPRDEEIAFRGDAYFALRLHRMSLESDEPQPIDTPTTMPFELEIAKRGTLEGIRFRESQRREPASGEVELHIDAIPLNFKDVLKLLGMLNDLVTEDTFFGTSIGMEAAATVVRTGDGVTGLTIGDRIIASISQGCMQSYITVPADRLFWTPALPGFSHVDLAALPVAFITALYCLRDVGRLQPGERVLLHSATGGVGLAAIQVARQIGAEIFATAGSEEKRDYLRSLDIEHVMDSRSLDFADRILERTGGKGVDVVLNFLTGEALEKNLACLAPYGRLIEIGKRDIAENNSLPLRPFNRNLMFASVDVDRLLAERPAEARRLFRDIWRHVEAGDYRPLPMQVFPIAELAEACRLLMQAKHIGKVVVSLIDQEVPLVPLRREEALFRTDASYLITGGFGGFGLEIAKWMIGQGVRHLVLAGRSGAATPAARAAVEALEEAGVSVLAAAIDIADEVSVRALLDEIALTLPPLRGVMHAAMVLDDAMLAHLDRDRLARVLAPKAAGAWLLHRLTRDLPLDHFVLFSSVSALFGNPGQGSYVAANAFLDALAHHRRCLGLPATSVNWGMLAEIGVAARDSTVAQHLERIGITGLTPRQAVEGLSCVLRDNPIQVGLMHIDWQRWGQVNPMARSWTRFAHLIGEAGQASSPFEELKQALIPATPEEREATLTALLAEEIAKALRLPAAKLDLHEPLSRIGVDSLTAVELQMAIQSLFQIELSALELMRGVSIAQLARQILEKLKLPDEVAIPQAAADAKTSGSPVADQSADGARAAA